MQPEVQPGVMRAQKRVKNKTFMEKLFLENSKWRNNLI
jgi:hypothetical protein